MLQRLIFISILLILSTAVFGQGKITLKEEKVSDLFFGSLQRTNAVGYLFKVDDGEYEAVGYKGENIETILKNDAEAYKEFEQFQKKTRGSKIFVWIAMATPFGLAASIDYSNDTEEDIRNKAIITSVVLVGSLVGNAILYRNAPKHLHNAVEIYNRNLE